MVATRPGMLPEVLEPNFRLDACTGQLRYREAGAPLLPVRPLFLVRHGETYINLKRDGEGWANSGLNDAENRLTPAGHEQARVLARSLIGEVSEKSPKEREITVVTSGLWRARETAEPFVAALRREGITPRLETDTGLDEINLGCWNNRLLSDSPEQAFDMKRFRFDADAALVPPGGESFVQLLERTHGAMQRVNQRYSSGLLLLFTHATTISAIRMHARDAVFADAYGVLRWTGKGIAKATYLRFCEPQGAFLAPQAAAH